jgi:hypothetical protein
MIEVVLRRYDGGGSWHAHHQTAHGRSRIQAMQARFLEAAMFDSVVNLPIRNAVRRDVAGERCRASDYVIDRSALRWGV